MAMPDKDENLEMEKENPKKSFQRKLNKLNEEKEKALADAEHWKNEYYRAYADTKNLRNQLEKDHMAAMKYRAEGFVDELLPVLDIDGHRTLRKSLTSKDTQTDIIIWTSRDKLRCHLFSSLDTVGL